MNYKISKSQCQKSINRNKVCSQCGGTLSPLETVDNSNAPTFWIGCKKCSRFGNGVPIDVYDIAKELVVNDRYSHYSHIEIEENDSSEMIKYKTQCQISGACYIVTDIIRIYNDIKNKKDKS